MTKNESTYRKAAERLENLQKRRDEIWANGEVAKSELSDYRKKSAKDLISGADGERTASELSKREAKAGMFGSALLELGAQIAQAQSVADEAEQKWNAELEAETVRQVRSATVKLRLTTTFISGRRTNCQAR